MIVILRFPFFSFPVASAACLRRFCSFLAPQPQLLARRRPWSGWIVVRSYRRRVLDVFCWLLRACVPRPGSGSSSEIMDTLALARCSFDEELVLAIGSSTELFL